MAVKEVHGPGPRGARGPRPKVENPGKLLKRIMDEVFRNYLPHCILVLVCIVVSALDTPSTMAMGMPNPIITAMEPNKIAAGILVSLLC